MLKEDCKDCIFLKEVNNKQFHSYRKYCTAPAAGKTITGKRIEIYRLDICPNAGYPLHGDRLFDGGDKSVQTSE